MRERTIRVSINNQDQNLVTGRQLDNLNLLREMTREKTSLAELGWIPVNPTHPAEFDDVPVKDGWHLMPDGLWYQLQCPLDGLNPMGHATSMGDSSKEHKKQAVSRAMDML